MRVSVKNKEVQKQGKEDHRAKDYPAKLNHSKLSLFGLSP